jgi:hypothetical protein
MTLELRWPAECVSLASLHCPPRDPANAPHHDPACIYNLPGLSRRQPPQQNGHGAPSGERAPWKGAPKTRRAPAHDPAPTERRASGRIGCFRIPEILAPGDGLDCTRDFRSGWRSGSRDRNPILLAARWVSAGRTSRTGKSLKRLAASSKHMSSLFANQYRTGNTHILFANQLDWEHPR